jgi:putative transposase
MPRTARIAPAGIIFHVINRGNARGDIFGKDGDFAAFEKILFEGLKRYHVTLLGYCLMDNHWHLVLRPEKERELGRFMQWLTVTHVRRWHEHRGSGGSGHLYQGTYRSFPIQADEHLLMALRYVERNALRAGLVKRAEDWRWCSLWWRERGEEAARERLGEWPVEMPADWVARVNRAQSEKEQEAMRLSIRRGRPFGDERWQKRMGRELGLASTFRERGRPRNRERAGK